MDARRDFMRALKSNNAYRSREVFHIANEFDFKVSYDFKRLVFLVPNGKDVNLDKMLKEVFGTTGYEAHKIIYHRKNPSHIYVRYVNEIEADRALSHFACETDVMAAKVSQLLTTIYTHEHISRRFPAWTLAIVDIEGTVQHTNPLSKEEVNRLLHKFGEPLLLDYHIEQFSIKHVQALFSSMAEALGASIANGCWYQRSLLESPRFCYRVRLVGSDKEREILNFDNSGGDNALQLDYFFGNDVNDSPSTMDAVMENPPTFYPSENEHRNMQREFSRSRSFLERNPHGQNRYRQLNHRQNRTYARSKSGQPPSHLLQQGQEIPTMSANTLN